MVESKQKLTHFDEKGRAKMVEVSAKVDTLREAVARGFVRVSKEVGNQVLKVIIENAYLDEQEKKEANEFVVLALVDAADGSIRLISLKFPKGA